MADTKPAEYCVHCDLEIVHQDGVLGGWYLHRYTGTKWCQPGQGRTHFQFAATPKRPIPDHNYKHRRPA